METPKILEAPHTYALGNLLLMFELSIWWTWKWCLIGAASHAVLALLWWYDPHCLMIFVQSVITRGPDGRWHLRRPWYGVA